MATHELGGLHLVAEMSTKYTLKDLLRMLEVCDAHDAFKKLARDQAEAEAKKK